MSLINNKYLLEEKIGEGNFGLIYKSKNIRTNEKVAIKIEPINNIFKLLKNEAIIYRYLSGIKGIVDIKWFGKDEINYYMVINLLEYSLKDLIKNKKQLSLLVTLKIGYNILNIIKEIHEKGIIHRDIKPENFMFLKNKIYLIDFGFCKFYLNNKKHIELKKTNKLLGSYNYASLNSHNCYELSRRDDLESYCYILLYLNIGYLEWSNVENEENIKILKTNVTNVTNEKKPKIILDLIKYSRNLKFEEKPNYFFILDILKNKINEINENNNVN